MEEIKNRIDGYYNIIVAPLDNYNQKTNTPTGMLDYIKILGEAVTSFAKFGNEIYAEVQKDSPELNDATADYLKEKYNNLISTYKAK
jgi:hypothetical protein